jgi:two-component system response regulator MprA
MPNTHRSLIHRQTITPRSNGAEPSKVAPRDRGGRSILVVDDDPAVREGLRRVLMTEGWEIVAVSGGEEALEYLQSHQPDLIITDLSMAAVSGWDLLFHENLQRPSLPVFVITALPPDAIGGADQFAHAFFQKPLDFDALIAAIRRHLGPMAGAP